MLDISDDYQYFDGLQDDLWLISQATNVVLDHTTGTYQNQRTEINLKSVLQRQVSERNAGIVRQVFERGKSITNDSVPTADTLLEVPVKVNEIKPRDGDTIQQRKPDGTVVESWQVLACDIATLKTRWRLACRTLR